MSSSRSVCAGYYPLSMLRNDSNSSAIHSTSVPTYLSETQLMVIGVIFLSLGMLRVNNPVKYLQL